MEPDEVIKAYRASRADYEYHPDIFDQDEERVRLVKQILSSLNQVDRTIIVLYAECQSYRKLGKALGLSHMTIRKEVLRIRAHILAEYDKLKTK